MKQSRPHPRGLAGTVARQIHGPKRKPSVSHHQSVGFIARYLARLDDLVRGRNFKVGTIVGYARNEWWSSQKATIGSTRASCHSAANYSTKS